MGFSFFRKKEKKEEKAASPEISQANASRLEEDIQFRQKEIGYSTTTETKESPAEIPPTTQSLSEREITAEDLKPQLDKGEVQLVDVRELWERNICKIEGDAHIRLSELSARTGELDKSKPVVAYCHTGNRSLDAQALLASQGFQARSLKGGIEAWADKLDPTMAMY